MNNNLSVLKMFNYLIESMQLPCLLNETRATRLYLHRCYLSLLNIFSTQNFISVKIVIPFCFLLFTSPSIAQQIPIGTWRTHISFNSIHHVAVSDQHVFGAAQSGVVVFNKADKSITSISKINGLSGAGITAIAYDQSTNQLLIGYENSKLDIVKNNSVKPVDPLQNTPLTGSKKINHIFIHNTLAYLATDYGLVVIDLMRSEIKETWRDLGPSGETLEIYGSTFKGDSIFIATEKGVMAGDIKNNLLDFKLWKRFSTGDFDRPIQAISFFNTKVYAAINGYGLYHWENASWVKENFFDLSTFQFLNASAEHLLIGADNKLAKLTVTNNVLPVNDEQIKIPQYAIEENGKLWVADSLNGMLSDYEGNSFNRYAPNGPASNSFRLRYFDEVMNNVSGGYAPTFQPLSNVGVWDKFDMGAWSTTQTSLLDITDVAMDQTSGSYYLSSFGGGVEKYVDGAMVTIYNTTNSPLEESEGSIKITALANSTDGLWVANYDAFNSLHLLKNDNTWESFSPQVAAARYPLTLTVDQSNNLWMIIEPSEGGGVFVFNKKVNTYNYLNTAATSGALPNNEVLSIAVDRDGLVWIGTAVGVAYFYSPSDESIKPIFENRFLLRDDKVTAIAVDGANRKWMGTERGVWLFSANGEELIYNFTSENSPLLSNVIRDIEMNSKTGEVFFATDKGVVSFRSDATEGSATSHIRIFPNPITRNFSGTVGLTGLATDAYVKITDISGKMIWQTQANGGTATWNVQDYNGRRAATGIYLVFAATADGVESVVGKIAVID